MTMTMTMLCKRGKVCIHNRLCACGDVDTCIQRSSSCSTELVGHIGHTREPCIQWRGRHALSKLGFERHVRDPGPRQPARLWSSIGCIRGSSGEGAGSPPLRPCQSSPAPFPPGFCLTQVAFAALLKRLQEYKGYMPDALFSHGSKRRMNMFSADDMDLGALQPVVVGRATSVVTTGRRNGSITATSASGTLSPNSSDLELNRSTPRHRGSKSSFEAVITNRVLQTAVASTLLPSNVTVLAVNLLGTSGWLKTLGEAPSASVFDHYVIVVHQVGFCPGARAQALSRWWSLHLNGAGPFA